MAPNDFLVMNHLTFSDGMDEQYTFRAVMPSTSGRAGLCYSWSELVLQSVLSPRWAWICVIWEGVCVSMYVHVLYVLHIVRDGLTSVGAILEEFTSEWKLQGWPLRHADHLYIRTLNNYLQLPVNSTLVIWNVLKWNCLRSPVAVCSWRQWCFLCCTNN